VYVHPILLNLLKKRKIIFQGHLPSRAGIKKSMPQNLTRASGGGGGKCLSGVDFFANRRDVGSSKVAPLSQAGAALAALGSKQ